MASSDPGTGFSVEMYEAYSSIMSLARKINTPVQVPEIVLVGKKGVGKTSLLEAILGHKFGDTGTSTMRPIEVKMVNNQQCATPKITFMHDLALPQFMEDTEIPLNKVPETIRDRNKKSSVPIRILYEFKYCWGMTIFDTPGLLPKSDPAEAIEEVESIVLELMTPPTRMLLCVEEATDWERVQIVDFVSKVDPKRSRSVFVFNKFAGLLKNFGSFRELQLFLSANPLMDTPVFFTSLPAGAIEAHLYKRRLAQLLKGDKDALELLQYDRRYEKSIGVVALQKYVLDWTLNKYQDLIPEILKRLRNHKKQAQQNAYKVSAQLEAMQPHQLRANASVFMSEFLQAIEELVQGSIEGRPAQNGETLFEEKAHEETGEWHDCERREITFNPADWEIASHASRLYGGQQLERLLNEFKAVVDRCTDIQVSRHEVAAALGTTKTGLGPDLIWAASDITRTKTVQILQPLVSQLIKRATYIMKNLVHIADSMLESKRAVSQKLLTQASVATVSTPVLGATSVDQYPYFAAYIKDNYNQFVDSVADKCLSKCLDEFTCTQLVCWQASRLGELPQLKPGADQEQIFAHVSELVQILFGDIKNRTVTNVILKCYNFFLVPMQSQLVLSMHGCISQLDDSRLNELFEVAVTKAHLTARAEHWNKMVESFLEQEHTFLTAAASFTHPVF
ncbi:dynamin family protein [Pelomyxa schiedti]|nr:dynamin family protein [Pelomyxa schiedti]